MDDQSLAEVDQGEALPDEQDTEQPSTDDSGSADTPEAVETPPADDAEEVDYEGAKYRVPKELKDALMRNADYTRKTQEVAEQRKALEQQQAEIQQAQALQQQHLQHYAQLSAIDSQLQQFARVDWQTLNQTDPVKAQELFFTYSQLKDARQTAATSLQQAQAQALEAQRAQRAKQIEESRAVVAREIPDWSPEKSQKLGQFAIAMGAPANVVANAVDPWFVRLVNDAYELSQLKAKANTPPPKPAAVVKPVSQLPAGKNAVQKDPSAMTDAEFAAFRRRQIAQRRS